MFFVLLPLQLVSIKGKTFNLNLNVYRNTSFRELSSWKKLFSIEVEPLIKHLPTMNKIRIEYRLYPASARTMDVSNICCIVDKFFTDALVESGKIPDDSYKHLDQVLYTYGSVSQNNPHVLALITPLY